VGFGAGLERLLIAMDEEGVTAPETPGIDVFVALEPGGTRGDVQRVLAELRAAGRSCDTDYAGRSLKGQLTQAGRLRAAVTAILGSDGATVRRAGTADEHVALSELVGRLLG
jgi:histidyl-tRNA synthetase